MSRVWKQIQPSFPAETCAFFLLLLTLKIFSFVIRFPPYPSFPNKTYNSFLQIPGLCGRNLPVVSQSQILDLFL